MDAREPAGRLGEMRTGRSVGMDAQELANRLREMYEDGRGRGRAVHMAILFGIRYAGEIEACGASPADIVQKAGTVPDSYATEVQKGRRLAEYVTVRPGSIPEAGHDDR